MPNPSNTPVRAEAEVPARDTSQARALAVEVARTLADDKCEQIEILDVSARSQVTDFLVIATGTSDRQMRSAADDAAELAKRHENSAYRRSQDDRDTWIVLDCIDVVVHIFEPNTRAFYNLEHLWQDAPRVPWERPGRDNRDHAGVHQ